MLVVTTSFRATMGANMELERLLCQLASKVQKNEIDALTYVVHRKIMDPSEFLIYGQYRNRKAFEDTHLNTPYYKEAQMTLPNLLRSGSESVQYEILDVH